ncbi:hypothetical protein D9619_012877 [Psilocybe cf. subviscida]|uniref:Armadillo repeat-containing protein 8 n=1 Tax=Psilocybe cf. subviscida TaxID=2480587 RepID=A0A8H5BIL0_9AGAR|nr:hypothetical protein D9619_012877 [Psilocybe cf. subviscida]
MSGSLSGLPWTLSTLLFTTMTISLATLKQVKNTVIGNPQAKSQLAKDDDFIVTLVHSLTQPPPAEINADRAAHEALKIEAAHVVASLAHGSDNAIAVVLRARAIHHFIYALSTFTSSNSTPVLRHAYMRGLRACASGAADVVGPSLWGLKPERGMDGFSPSDDVEEQERRKQRTARMWADAKEALDYLFQVESMDIYLPLLVLPPPTSTPLSFPPSAQTASASTPIPIQKSRSASSSIPGPTTIPVVSSPVTGPTTPHTASLSSAAAPPPSSSAAAGISTPPPPPPFPSTPTLFTHAAHLLSTTLRSPAHRKAVAEWVPHHLRAAPSSTSMNKRARAVSLGRRGWETVGVNRDREKEREREMCAVKGVLGVLGFGVLGAGGASAGGGSKDPKVVEAALSALAALARDNPPVAAFLGKQGSDREYPPVLPHLLAFTKARAVDVQLAACLCVTNILRALPASNNHSHPTTAPASAVSPSSLVSLPHPYPTPTGAAPSPGATIGHMGSASVFPHATALIHSLQTSNPYPSAYPMAGGGSGFAYGSAGGAGPSEAIYSSLPLSSFGPVSGAGSGSGIPIGTSGGGTGGVAGSSGLGLASHNVSESVSAYSLVHNLPGGGSAPGPSQAAVEETCLRTVMNVVNRMLGLAFAGFRTGSGGYPGSGAGDSTSSGAGGNNGGGSAAARGAAAAAVASLAGGATTTGMAAARGAAAAAAAGGGAGGVLGDAELREAEREREAKYQAAMAGAVARTKACYILHNLVVDDPALCHLAYERGCLSHLGALVLAISPPEPPPLDWEEGEPESIRELREAALTALASLALHSDDIRRDITDSLRLLPAISRALRAGSSSSASAQLRAKHIGTRHAACQVVRAMSRSVSVLRTSIVDSGLGMDVLRIVLGQGTELGDRWGGSVSAGSSRSGISAAAGGGTPPSSSQHGKGREKDAEGLAHGLRGTPLWLGDDRRVIAAALSAVCNIVNDFSPLRPIYLEEKLMPRLVAIIRESQDAPLRLNALWAVKNLVRKTSTETKRDIMSHVGWAELNQFLTDPNLEMQEQAFNLLRNLAENEDGIAMVFRELTSSVLLEKLVYGLNSPSEDVVLQAAFALANLANGTQDQQDSIMQYPGILSALKTCLEEAPQSIRRPAVSCVFVLAKSNPRRRREMQEVGIVSTLKKICEWSGHGHGPSHGHTSHGSYSGSAAGNYGMSVSPTASTASGAWGGRSPTARASGMTFYHGSGGMASGGGGSTYGSWSGSGSSLHAHAAAHGIGGSGTTSRPWSTPHLGLLEDDRDVVNKARQALDWLEHGETYTM